MAIQPINMASHWTVIVLFMVAGKTKNSLYLLVHSIDLYDLLISKRCEFVNQFPKNKKDITKSFYHLLAITLRIISEEDKLQVCVQQNKIESSFTKRAHTAQLHF